MGTKLSVFIIRKFASDIKQINSPWSHQTGFLKISGEIKIAKFT